MNQIITISCNIWLQREAVGPRCSLVQSFSFSPACLFVWTSKTNGGVKTQGDLQRDCFLLLFLLLHHVHAQLRRAEPDWIKKCVSEKRWLMQRTSRGGRVEDISPPRGLFQREANTNMVARSLRCCVMAMSDSETYWLSCFWMPVGRLLFPATDILRASCALLGLDRTSL